MQPLNPKEKIILLFCTGVVFFAIGYLVAKQTLPAKVETKVQYVEVIHTKEVAMKAKDVSKKKVLVTNADGSSTLTETSDSKTLEYLQMVQDLQKKLAEEQTVRNNLARVNVLATYGSDFKPAAEVNGSYDIWGGKYEHFIDGAWRAGVGLGFSF